MLPSSTKRLSWPLTLLLVGALPACDGITAPQTEPLLEVEARVEPGHIHSFETDVTFYAAVTNPADFTAVEDFTMIRAEISPAGAEDWTKQIPLTFNGTEYAGTTKFTANGTFDGRIVGQRPGQDEPVELKRLETPLESVRPHFDAGGYRVEFETSTAEYPVAGEPVTFHFLIMEDVASPRPPVIGLPDVKVRCVQGAENTLHDAVETPDGTYSAPHTFNVVGDATATLEFTGLDLLPASVEIPLVVN